MTEDLRETAARVVRYFTVALPLHAADEDELVAPRLVGAGRDVTEALATVEREHIEHQALIDALVDACREPIADASVIAAAAEAVGTHMAVHLELEEAVVFPALRALPASERAAIVAAMKQRRSSGA